MASKPSLIFIGFTKDNSQVFLSLQINNSTLFPLSPNGFPQFLFCQTLLPSTLKQWLPPPLFSQPFPPLSIFTTPNHHFLQLQKLFFPLRLKKKKPSLIPTLKLQISYNPLARRSFTCKSQANSFESQTPSYYFPPFF